MACAGWAIGTTAALTAMAIAARPPRILRLCMGRSHFRLGAKRQPISAPGTVDAADTEPRLLPIMGESALSEDSRRPTYTRHALFVGKHNISARRQLRALSPYGETLRFVNRCVRALSAMLSGGPPAGGGGQAVQRCPGPRFVRSIPLTRIHTYKLHRNLTTLSPSRRSSPCVWCAFVTALTGLTPGAPVLNGSGGGGGIGSRPRSRTLIFRSVLWPPRSTARRACSRRRRPPR